MQRRLGIAVFLRSSISVTKWPAPVTTVAVLFAVAIAVATLPISGAVRRNTLAADWYETTRCNDSSPSSVCGHYKRCKATHRCALGEEGVFAHFFHH